MNNSTNMEDRHLQSSLIEVWIVFSQPSSHCVLVFLASIQLGDESQVLSGKGKVPNLQILFLPLRLARLWQESDTLL